MGTNHLVLRWALLKRLCDRMKLNLEGNKVWFEEIGLTPNDLDSNCGVQAEAAGFTTPSRRE